MKVIELNPHTLQILVNYTKTFLMVATIVLTVFAILFLLGYEKVSMEANRTQNICKISYFSFLRGTTTKTLQLSEIQTAYSNISHKQSGKYNTTYERPSVVLKNGESYFFLKKNKSVAYTSDLPQKFNAFLQQNQKDTFQGSIVYLGILNAILIGTLGFTFLALVVIIVLVGNIKIVLNKKSNTFSVRYSSPIRSNKQGDLASIKKVLILTKIPVSSSTNQTGLYFELENQELIMVRALGIYKPEQAEEYLLPMKQNAEKIAHFLQLEVGIVE